MTDLCIHPRVRPLPTTYTYRSHLRSPLQPFALHLHARQYYDIPNQKHRDNQLTGDCAIVGTLLELGNDVKMAYHYDDKTLDCQKYPFTSTISQYVHSCPPGTRFLSRVLFHVGRTCVVCFGFVDLF